MATYVYDDFRVTLTPRSDGTYDVRAVDDTGVETVGTFRLPLTDDDLAGAVRGAVEHARGGDTTRDIGGAGPPALDAEHVGAALADALLTGPVGAAYDRARAAAASAGRGLRLSLSLAGAPALLSVPWEFVYKRPRFLASQRQTPLVRLLDTGARPSAAVIDSTVRILGVIASPRDLAPLEVDKERQGVELAVAKVRQLGRVQLDWLEPATPKVLREALRDGSYHVLHFVGHSDFTPSGDGVLYLENADGQSSAVDETLFANLLSDQDQLRLVVLNSCEGARTTLTDPYAGVATTLISLGVPAVVAMQFEISDRAAIVFAEELYTNLIGRQDPIDAAVAEARKAVYSQVDPIEWATPVLFVRDPEVELFRFGVPAAPLPPPPPPGLPTLDRGVVADHAPRRGRGLIAALVVGAVVVAAAAAVFALTRADGDDASGTTTVPVSTGPQPRPRTGFHAVQVLEPDGDVHMLNHDPGTGFVDAATSHGGAHDTEPDWDRATNRLAFSRAEPSPSCTGICYVVPNDATGDGGKQVAQLVPFVDGRRQHAPAWSTGSTLYYARSAGCSPGPGCAEEVRRARFEAAADGTGFGDALTVAGEVVVATGFEDIRDLDADPQDPDAFVVATAGGVTAARGGVQQELATTIDVSGVTFTPDGNRLVAVGAEGGRSTLAIWNRDGTPLDTVDVATAAGTFASAGGVLPGLRPERAVAMSITPDAEGGRVLVLLDDPDDAAPPVLATVEITEQGSATIISSAGFPIDVLRQGEVQAVAR